MSNARRDHDDEPLTQLDVDVDTKHLDALDALDGEASTSPGEEPDTEDRTIGGAGGADDEPQTMEPPRKMGVPRLRAPTIMGIAPPSSGSNGPPTTSPEPKIVSSGAVVTPGKITIEGEDEQTTLVGKLLAEAHLEVRNRLKERAKDKEGEKEPDLYQDETATTVGDAEKLIAIANANIAKGRGDEGDVDEPTESRSLKDALVEDTTSKRDAINIDEALARAAELRAEAEARKKRAAKKRTMHGLGDGPLTLPARPKVSNEDEIPTSENRLDDETIGTDDTEDAMPADGEKETLSVATGMSVPLRSLNTEPETMPVHVPLTSRERKMTDPVHGSALLVPSTTLQSPPSTIDMPPMHSGHPAHAGHPAQPGPWTQPMPLAPTVRMDDSSGGGDLALRATMNQPAGNGMAPHPPSSPHQLPVTPPGGVPHFHSTPMPVPVPMGMPHSGPAAFARTAVATGSVNAVPDEKKKGGRGGLVVFILLLAVAGGAGYWRRAMLKDTWERYRHPPPRTAEPAPVPSASVAEPAPSTAPAVVPAVADPNAGASASASASASPSAHPSATPSAHPSASASASTKPNAKKPPPWKPPPWKPPPKKTTPKPAPDNGGNYGF